MTNEEAIKYILWGTAPNYTCANNKRHGSNHTEFEAFNMAIKALEKQIPKKPENVVRYHNICVDWNCSSCKRFHRTDNAIIDYCFDCGQAIDWSDDNGNPV